MKNKKYYFLIVIYGLLLIFVFLGFNHLYGSTTDWISQHSVLPDYFRNMFYETGRLVPNFAFNLGAGQNIYNYSYYGLLSPIILISYLLPFIDMTYYIMGVSITLYLLFGVLIFKFINDNFNDSKMAFFISLIAMSIASINYNFHHHIMFVWYLPFLMISLMGVDRYLKNRRSDLLIFSTFLLIMTNYYYGVSSLVVIFLYAVYKILDKNKFEIKSSFKEAFILGLHLIVPVLMSMIILLPTLYCLKNGSRSHVDVPILDIVIPNFAELFYNPVGLGITCSFLVILICNVFTKKKDKCDLFLNVCLLIVFVFPIISFILNGMLYARGKVLIPFIPLFLYAFVIFIRNLEKRNINIKNSLIFLIIFSLIASVFRKSNFVFLIDLFLAFAFIYISIRKKNKKYFIGYIFVSLMIVLVVCNIIEDYIKLDYYHKVNNPGIEGLYNNIDDESIFRSYNDLVPKVDVNKSYNSKYYSPSIYSSTYNRDYWEFYNFYFGNNMKYRNVLMTTGSDNDLFYTFMGVKYITSPNKKSLYYEKIDSNNGINLYYNKDSFPLMYVPNKLGGTDYVKSLKFPYDMEYTFLHSIVDGVDDSNFTSNIIKTDLGLRESYDFNFKKKTHKRIELDNKYNGKILYISFKMNKNKECKIGAEEDLYISINGVKNKLTCGGYIYHNKNNVFEYVIPILDSSEGLDIEFGKGKYNISDINVYYSDKITSNNRAVNNIVIDKKNDTISGDITLEEANYLITSIPYDEGFSVFVNDREVKYEKVNRAFLGFKLKKGDNKIVIKYNSFGYNLGKYISIMGVIIFIFIICFENRGMIHKKRDD